MTEIRERTTRVSDTVQRWLSEDHPHVIGGERVASASGRTFVTLDPSTGDDLATVAYAEAADVDRAVQAAREAFSPISPWRRMVPGERARLLYALADLVEANGDALAELESLDNGKPIKFARRVDVPSAVRHLRYFAGWTTKISGATLPVDQPLMHAYTLREPVGVCGQIIPWNFPLLMAVWKLAPALAAGCCCVLKPAEQTPLTALKLAELAIEAGFPPGVINVIAGDGETGAAIVDHPDVDKISFTGSTVVGREIAAKAGAALKRVTLELGGKSPNIVLDDADIHAAIKGAFTGMYFNSGQVCSAASRLLVPAPRFDEVVDGLRTQIERAVVGPGLDPKTFVGPLVSAEQQARVREYIDLGRSEATLLMDGGAAPDTGYFVPPTMFEAEDDDARIVREEIFGPVLVVQRYSSLEEVAERANASAYGLAAGIWGRDFSRVHRLAALLRAGSVYVNSWGTSDPAAPFGGFKASGIGREHGVEGLDAYLETKTVLAQL